MNITASAMAAEMRTASNEGLAVAIQAAPIAFAIGNKFCTTEKIVLRAEDFVDVHASLRIALAATATPRRAYRVLELVSNGAGLVDLPDFERSQKLIVVSSVRTTVAISQQMEYSVVWTLSGEIDQVLRQRRSGSLIQIVVLETPQPAAL